MRLFSGLYARVMVWARHKYATYWLALVSFAIDTDTMLSSMPTYDPLSVTPMRPLSE